MIDAFAALRAAAEKAGVFVLLMGNLGTHHTDIDALVFRGFALADHIAPFIVINENDSRAAWSFTLLHELAHVFLGETGISGYDGETEVEKFCDSVAGRFLLDPAELSAIGAKNAVDFEELVRRIDAFAVDRNLSRKMVAYNLLRAGHITRQFYRELSGAFDADRLERLAKKGGPGCRWWTGLLQGEAPPRGAGARKPSKADGRGRCLIHYQGRKGAGR